MFRLRLPDAEDLADFIVRNYGNAKKIVEIGVGSYPWVAKSVKDSIPGAKVVVTDICEDKLGEVEEICPQLDLACDDILKPQLEIYAGASLIYSVRPPPELVSEILKLASRVGCDVFIRPLFHEECDFDFSTGGGWRSVRHGRAIFYLLRRRS